MMEFETLYKGKYVSLVSPIGAPYECLHEKDGALIVPIIGDKIGVRLEFCPPYFIKSTTNDKLFYTVMSGGMDEKDNGDCVKTALRELKEEGGITVKKGKAYRIYENKNFNKGTDALSSLVLINILEYDKEEPEGDGTSNEEKSKTIWVTLDELVDIIKKPNCDSLLFWVTMYLKLIGRE